MSDCMIHGDAINMSNERAIEILKPLQKMMCDQHGCPISDAYFAVEKAIRALERSEKHIALDTGGLISRDALKRSIENAKRLGKNAIDYYIDQQPTIDAVPVVHGEWILIDKATDDWRNNDYNFECSKCHHKEVHDLNDDVPYCWYCGAKMDELQMIDSYDYDNDIDWRAPSHRTGGAKMDGSNASNASNALNALDNVQDGPIITPCCGCSDYDGYGGCKSKGGCARAKMDGKE